MEVTVEYDIRLPVPMFGSPGAQQKETFTISAWTGSSGSGGEAGEDSGIVYVTDNRAVYHENPHCSYLSFPSVSFRRTDWTPCAMYGEPVPCMRSNACSDRP